MNYNINGLKIILNSEVIDEIKKYYNSSLRYETGGVLIGKFNKDNKVIEVIEVYELKTNFFSKILYKRNVKKAQKIINKRWHESGGVLNYVGEWHTHPNMRALPSHTDINSLKEIASKVHEILPGVVMIIAGDDNEINLVIQFKRMIKIFPLFRE